MLLLTLRGLVAHRLRLLTTIVATALGVAFMSGSLVLIDTVNRTREQVFAEVNLGTDAVLRRVAAFDTPLGPQRTRLPQGLIATVLAVDGVSAAEGTVEGYAQLVGPDGEPVGDPGRGRAARGQNWKLSRTLNPWHLLEGRAPRSASEVAIDQATAADTGFGVGDPVTILLQGPPQEFDIVGVARFADRPTIANDSVALFTTETAQAVVGQPEQFDTILVEADPQLSQTELVSRLTSIVPADIEPLTGEGFAEDNRREVRRNLSFLSTTLQLFAAIALIVGSFIIHNTFAMIVAQRQSEIALVRALGAAPRQIAAAVLTEASIVGTFAAMIGLAAGFGAARLLELVIEQIAFVVPTQGLVISPRTILVSLLLGVFVTVGSALQPAYRASSIPPLAVLRNAALEPERTSWARAATAVLATAIALLAAGVVIAGFTSRPDRAVMVAGLSSLIAVTAFGPLIARPLGWALGHTLLAVAVVAVGGSLLLGGLGLLMAGVIERHAPATAGGIAAILTGTGLVPAGLSGFGLSGQLGRDNTLRNPRRTATTAAALTIGVAIVATFMIMAESVKTSVTEAVNQSFSGDLVVDATSLGAGGFSPDLARQVRELDSVEVVSGIRANQAKIDGQTIALRGADTAGLLSVFDVDIESSLRDSLGPTDLAVFSGRAARNGWQLGDMIDVEFATTGVRSFQIAMLYNRNELAGDYFVDSSALEANFADQIDYQVFIRLAPDAGRRQALEEISSIVVQFPNANLRDAEQFARAQAALIDQLLGLVFALLGLAILIALLGIANTLALSVVERSRELGMLRAVGMAPHQLRAVVRWESVIIALIGTVLGLTLGTGFGWAIVKSLADQGLQQVRIPVLQLAATALIAVLAGIAAAVLPAYRASRVNVLDAIS